MNIASLLEMIAGTQAAIPASLTLPAGEATAPTFQASLLAAQSSAGSFLHISADEAIDARQSATPNPDDKKSQPSASEPVPVPSRILPQASAPKQASPSLAVAVGLPKSTPQLAVQQPSSLATTLLPSRNNQTASRLPQIIQPGSALPAAITLPVVVAAAYRPVVTVSALRPSSTKVAGVPGKHQAVAASVVAKADPAVPVQQTPVAVPNTATPVFAPVPVVPLATRPSAPTDDAATTHPAPADPSVSDNTYTAPTVPAILEPVTTKVAVTQSIALPTTPIATVAQRSVPTPVLSDDSRLTAEPAPHAPATTAKPLAGSPEVAANIPATPPPAAPAPAPVAAPQIPHPAAEKPSPAAPPAPPTAPAVQNETPTPAVADPVVSPVVPLLLEPALPLLTPVKPGNAPATAKTSVSPVSNANEPTPAVTGTTTPAVHAASGAASAQADAQSGSQPGDQTQQVSTAVHGQTATTPQTSGAGQTVTVTDRAPLTPAPPPSAGVPHDAKTATVPTPAAAPLHQTPEVNTARLIQTAGQSEMRVGLRSNEFGDISIRTSSTRDVLSAQISLDHDELARTLATHLPEIQAKLGGAQPMELRIDMNGQAAGQQSGQGQGTAGGTANGSSQHSPSGQPNKASASPTTEVRPSAAPANPVHQAADRRLDVTA